MSVEALEDSTWNVAPLKKFGDEIIHADLKQVSLKCDIFNDLGHMEVAQLSFLKGLSNFIIKPSK
jgi:hypothetical protein